MKKIILMLCCGCEIIFSRGLGEKSVISYSYKGINEIVTTLSVLDVEVLGSDRSDTVVELVAIPKEINIDIEIIGARLIVRSTVDKWFNSMPFSKNRIIIHVPNHFDLDLTNGTGDTEIDNVIGSLKVNTLSGDIIASGIYINKDSSFETTAGDIYISFKNSFDSLCMDFKSVIGYITVSGAQKTRSYTTPGQYRVKSRSVFGDQKYYAL